MKTLFKAAVVAATFFLASCASTQTTQSPTCGDMPAKPSCHSCCKSVDHQNCMHECKKKSCKRHHHKAKATSKTQTEATTPAASTTTTTTETSH